MPSYPVINRRNISPLVRKTLLVSEEAVERINGIGAELHVSQGSLVDTALRHLAAMSSADVAELVRANGHLTDEEYDYVMARAKKKGRK